MELSKYFEREYLGNGTYSHIQHVKPIAYYDAGWHYNNSDWTDGVQYPHTVLASDLVVTVGVDGERRLHPTREEDKYVSLNRFYIRSGVDWVQPSWNSFSRNGNLLTSTNTNFNVYIQHIGHALKFAFLLKNGYVPQNNQVAFPVGLSNLTRQGTTIYDGETPVLRFIKPKVWDYAVHGIEPPDDAYAISYSLENINGQWYIVMTLPPEVSGMTSPFIDPTYESQPDAASGIDTYNSKGSSADNSYGTGTYIYIRTTTAWPAQNIGFIKFDVSSIPAGVTVGSATLRLVSANTGTTGTIHGYSILSANNGWIEENTWNYADGAAASQRWAGDTGGDGGDDAGCSVSGTDHNATQIVSIDTNSGDPIGTVYSDSLDTTMVGDWINGANYGMAFYPTALFKTFRPASSDNATAADRPKLTIVYSSHSPLPQYYRP